jgi:prophage antirepressor-like protein
MTTAQVVPFRFESHEVRTLTIDGNPWFVAKDVCDVLGIGMEQTRRLDDDEKGLRKVQTPGGD